MTEAAPAAEALPQPEALADPLCLMRREPILDKDKSLVAYGLTPLWTGGVAGDAGEAVLAHCRRFDVNRFLGRLPHQFQASAAMLRQPAVHMLPHNRSLLDIPEGLEVTPELLQNFAALSRSGLRFALRGDLAANPAYDALLPFCKSIHFDPARSTKAEIFRQTLAHKQAGRTLSITTPSTPGELDTALILGFSRFHGAWPRPSAATSAFTPRQKTLLRLLTLAMGDSGTPEIQACIAQDSELSAILLNMVNTPAFGLPQEVESLNQAIMLLGRRQLQRWVQMLMYTEAGKPKGFLSPTLIQACARACLLEQLSVLQYPEQTVRAEAAFAVGMFSTMDQLISGLTMHDLLAQITVDVPVRQALTNRSGALGPDLRLAILLFPLAGEAPEDAAPLLEQIGLEPEQLAPLIQQAFEWSHDMTQAAQ